MTDKRQEVLDFYNEVFRKKIKLTEKWSKPITKALMLYDLNIIKKAIYGCAHGSHGVSKKYLTIEFCLRTSDKYRNIERFSKLCDIDFNEEVEKKIERKEIDVKVRHKFRRKENEIDKNEIMSWEEFLKYIAETAYYNCAIVESYKDKFYRYHRHYDRDTFEKAIHYIIHECNGDMRDYHFKLIIDRLPLNASKYRDYHRRWNSIYAIMHQKYNKRLKSHEKVVSISEFEKMQNII